MTYSAALLAAAQSYVGVTESGGNNRGPEIDAWLAGVGLGHGFAWCAAFLHGMGAEAAEQLQCENLVPRVAGVMHMWELANSLFSASVPTPGAAYFVQHDTMHGHCGIVESVAPDGTVVEISGNTNAAGSREGDSVQRHTWNWYDAMGRGGANVAAVHGGHLLGFCVFEPIGSAA